MKAIDQIPQQPIDCYQVAEHLYGSKSGVHEAAKEMRTAGWTFLEYNEYGEEVHQPPTKFCAHCGGQGGAIGSGLESDGPCHSGPYQ